MILVGNADVFVLLQGGPAYIPLESENDSKTLSAESLGEKLKKRYGELDMASGGDDPDEDEIDHSSSSHAVVGGRLGFGDPGKTKQDHIAATLARVAKEDIVRGKTLRHPKSTDQQEEDDEFSKWEEAQISKGTGRSRGAGGNGVGGVFSGSMESKAAFGTNRQNQKQFSVLQLKQVKVRLKFFF